MPRPVTTTFKQTPSAQLGQAGYVGHRPSSDPHAVAWLVFLFGAFWPRLFIVGFWIFSREIGDAFDSWVVPALGLLLLPWTTFSYAIMWGISSDAVSGAEWAVVAIGLLLDLGTWAAAARLLRS
jgi:hypothetical protein